MNSNLLQKSFFIPELDFHSFSFLNLISDRGGEQGRDKKTKEERTEESR